jgi:hypothetical protein
LLKAELLSAVQTVKCKHDTGIQHLQTGPHRLTHSVTRSSTNSSTLQATTSDVTTAAAAVANVPHCCRYAPQRTARCKHHNHVHGSLTRQLPGTLLLSSASAPAQSIATRVKVWISSRPGCSLKLNSTHNHTNCTTRCLLFT